MLTKLAFLVSHFEAWTKLTDSGFWSADIALGRLATTLFLKVIVIIYKKSILKSKFGVTSNYMELIPDISFPDLGLDLTHPLPAFL